LDWTQNAVAEETALSENDMMMPILQLLLVAAVFTIILTKYI